MTDELFVGTGHSRAIINPLALQEHICESFPSLLSKCICPLERLQNLKFKVVFDTGLWISPDDHFTVIYTSVSEKVEDCWFQIGVHGRQARLVAKAAFKGKYSGDFNFERLNKVLGLISNELENKS